MSDTDDDLQLLTRAVAAFGDLVSEVGDDEWDQPTGVTEWNIQSLVAHVVVTDSQAAGLIRGDEVSWVIDVDISVLGTNPVAAWRGTALGMLEAFRGPGALDADYDHPLGRLSGRRLLGNRVSENVAHGWDLAQGLGRPFAIADDLGDWLLDFWMPHVEALDPDFFGPRREVDPQASYGERFLALVGRG